MVSFFKSFTKQISSIPSQHFKKDEKIKINNESKLENESKESIGMKILKNMGWKGKGINI